MLALTAAPEPSAPGTKPKLRHRLRDPRAPIPLPSNLAIPRYTPGPPPFDCGETLVYSASWEGIPAAEARISVAYPKVNPDHWTGQMTINTSKVVDPLYRMRDFFRENFDRNSLQPDDIYIVQHEKSRLDEWRGSFDHDAHLFTAVKTNRAGRTWIRRFSGGDPWGPFSGAMLALSQPLTIGQRYVYDLFSGGNRYVLAFTVVRRERITTALGTFDSLRIEPEVVWLSEGSFRNDATSTTVWVTADRHHLPLRIESAVYIGSVRADHTRVIGASPPAGSPVAQHVER